MMKHIRLLLLLSSIFLLASRSGGETASQKQSPQILYAVPIAFGMPESYMVPPTAIKIDVDISSTSLNDTQIVPPNEEKTVKFNMTVNSPGLVVINWDAGNLNSSIPQEVFNPSPNTPTTYEFDYSTIGNGMREISIMACTEFVTEFTMNNRAIAVGIDISPLSNLQELTISNCRIAGTVDLINSAETIEILTLPENHFISSVLPFSTVGNSHLFQALTTLDFSRNDLSGTIDLSQSTNLEIININGNVAAGASNGGNELDACLLPASSSTIKSITLNDNQIAHGFDFVNYPSLTDLQLSDNQVSPTGNAAKPLLLGVHPQLVSLKAHHSLWDDIVDISQCDQLIICNLGYNKITTIQIQSFSVAAAAHPLDKLELQFNELVGAYDFRAYSNLTHVDLDGYTPSNFPSANNQINYLQFNNLVPCKLQYLRAQYNELIHIIGLNTCSQLEDLNVAANNLTVLPEVNQLTQLKSFQAWGNGDLYTHFDLSNFPQLEVIALHNTDITDLTMPTSSNATVYHLTLQVTEIPTATLETIVQWVWDRKCVSTAALKKFSIKNSYSSGISNTYKYMVDGINGNTPSPCGSASGPCSNDTNCTIAASNWQAAGGFYY